MSHNGNAGDWDEYSVHIIESLRRIEKKIDEHDRDVAKQTSLNELRFGKIEADIIKTGINLAWHSRVASMLAVLVGSVISWFIESRRHG